MCFICEILSDGHFLHVHHLTYKRVGRENLSDLVTLCKRCHTDIHLRPRYDKRGLQDMKDKYEEEKYHREELTRNTLIREQIC